MKINALIEVALDVDLDEFEECESAGEYVRLRTVRREISDLIMEDDFILESAEESYP